MKKVLITGAAGYIGAQLTERLRKEDGFEVIATDLRFADTGESDGLIRIEADLRTEKVADLIRKEKPDAVVHLAAIVVQVPGMTREFIYDVEVNGTRRILDACVDAGVKQFVVTSSGAAYGYHADNAEWLTETDPIRGNEEFAYSWHKRVIEEMLTEYREKHPGLKQLIFRVSTILGDHTQNDITNLFQKKRILVMRGSETPFVIIWDQDLLQLLTIGLEEERSGIYNVAGDGAVTLREMARLMKKPVLALPAGLIRTALSIARPLGLSRYGPEQVKFLLYRPVLSNRKLREEFGFHPVKTSKETFLYYAEKNGLI